MPNKTAKVIAEAEDRPSTFGWLQIDKAAARRLRELTMTAPAAAGVLLYCIERMSRTNSLLVSQTVMAEAIGLTDRSIRTAIKTLEEKKFIERTMVGTASVITVNTRVAWQGKRGARYAHFSADIVAVEKEQKKPVEDRGELEQIPVLKDGERLMVTNDELGPPDQNEMELD